MSYNKHLLTNNTCFGIEHVQSFIKKVSSKVSFNDMHSALYSQVFHAQIVRQPPAMLN